ncbi:3-oxoacyl-ACP synthase [Xenorhabdus mauleonii]|uniref:3-oxoacyl-ACP synthase n=1 Tax=Xenorhabdus mauleonii TaxID=351675 RepID=A0A1I3S7V4_9GAMM|nr:ketoacyl-ACP synthase III family protein [Xenorhabdus mauleonii]PHM39089.1 3-oxoacyl-ACP synthase [Xenorhabdus mauleonii]SFJ54913.1 3-oxoacyl-[acyl-carrier-protein] synthase-3 [Xenorhabdus mauleonii]
MRHMTLDRLSSYLPATTLVLERDYERLGISQNQARVFSRMYELPNCPIEEGDELNMLQQTCEELLEDDDQLRQKIGIVIYAHTGAVSGVWGQSIVTQLVRALGLQHAMPLATCSNNCVAIFSALDIARHYLQGTTPDTKALIVVGEIADNVELRVVANVAIVGDGAGAGIFSLAGSGPKVLAHAIHTWPGYAHGIWLPTNSECYKDFELHYQFRLKAVIDDVLGQTGTTLDQISWVVPHNVNIWMWRRAATYLGFSLEKIFLSNIRRTAHCLGADMFINFHSLQEGVEFQGGDKVLMVSTGVGGVFGAALFQY